jgi:hypothetical protein
MKKMRNHIKKVIALTVLLILVGSVIVAGAKAPDSQRDWKEMCGKANGLIWGAVCELLDRVIALEDDLRTLDEAVDEEVASLVTADDGLSSDIATLTTVDDGLSSDIATLTTVDDGLSSDIATLTTVDDGLSLDIATLTTVDDGLSLDIATLTTVDDGLSLDIATLTTEMSGEVTSREEADDDLSSRIRELEDWVLAFENGGD